MLTEKEKYELVWRKVARYGKDWTNPGLASSVKSWIVAGMTSGSSVMDFGCGNGTSLKWLASQGYRSKGVDIAHNATDHPSVIIADLRYQPELGVSDYGLCTDLMEHIPTDDVDAVLDTIANSVKCAVLFVIARDEDRDGAEVGQVLHLTRKNAAWWNERILSHFSRVEVLRYNPSDESAYSLWAFK